MRCGCGTLLLVLFCVIVTFVPIRSARNYSGWAGHSHVHNRFGELSSAPQPKLKTPRQNLEPVFQWKQIAFQDLPGEEEQETIYS